MAAKKSTRKTKKSLTDTIRSAVRKAVKKKKKTVAKKTTRRRKARTPKIAAHGKTTAQRRKYIEYLGAKKKLIKQFFKE